MQNVALHKPATQSSTSSWSKSPLPEKDARGANNGDMSGEMGFHTIDEQDPWWQVDLTASFCVRKICLFNRRHKAERLRFFSLLVSMDGEVWRTVFRKDDPQIFGRSSSSPYIVTLPEGVVARYVRVRLDGCAPLHFSELEVYGDEVTSSDGKESIEFALTEEVRSFGLSTESIGQITILQTSDAFNYADMLFATSRTVRELCRKQGLQYEAYIGLKRGFYPYQATFNRIYMLSELVDRGYKGWALYLDADAFVADLDFDLHNFLMPLADKAFLATPSGASNEPWDVNAGVFFMNLSHPVSLIILKQWRAAYEAADEDRLRECTQWYTGLDDQQMLHEILKALPARDEACSLLPWELINSPTATFIRQHLRAMHDDMATRTAAINKEVERIMDANA